jgi:hypothetical protein
MKISNKYMEQKRGWKELLGNSILFLIILNRFSPYKDISLIKVTFA